MVTAGGDDELRVLQRKAYARDGALTPAEADRLRELEEQRRFATAAASPVSHAAAPADARAGSAPASARSSDVRPGADASTDAGDALEASIDPDGDTQNAPDAAEEARETVTSGNRLVGPLRSRRGAVAVVAALALIAVGVGIGWSVFGRPPGPAVALTAEQRAWQEDVVASDVYDPGSVRALAVEEGVVLWTATQQQGERTCLILGAGASTMPSCDRTEIVQQSGLYGSFTLSSDDDGQRQVSAQLLLGPNGEAVVAASTGEYSTAIQYANDEESATARRLAEAGFDPGSIWVTGYDGDVPLWSATQVETGRQCLIYDGSTADAPVACETPETLAEYGPGLFLQVTDAETGAVTNYELPGNVAGPSVLVITREGSVAGAGGD
ncbi:hypothetical protein [Microbacterium paraoxydans]|uniref:hypothetical protein n=1 Tax=Microbacterium paraoxydans TaxID=199592 RepID=UPI003D7525EB